MMFMGCHNWVAEMLLKVRAQGKGHYMSAEMLSPNRPSRSITGGHAILSEMPTDPRPQLFTWCRARSAEMPTCWRAKGKGQVNVAEMPTLLHPSQPITGGHRQLAEMPFYLRPQINHMVPLHHRKNATNGAHHWGPSTSRSNAIDISPPPNLGHCRPAAMPKSGRPNNNDQRPLPVRNNAKC